MWRRPTRRTCIRLNGKEVCDLFNEWIDALSNAHPQGTKPSIHAVLSNGWVDLAPQNRSFIAMGGAVAPS